MDSRFRGDTLKAANFLKAMGHQGRLQILCLLLEGEMSAGDVQSSLSLSQPAASQLLIRLRREGMIESRRQGQNVHYRISDERVSAIVGILTEMLCSEETSQ